MTDDDPGDADGFIPREPNGHDLSVKADLRDMASRPRSSGQLKAVGTFDFFMHRLLGKPDVANDGTEGGWQNAAWDDGNKGGHGTKYGMTQPFYDEARRRQNLPRQEVRFANEFDARTAYRLMIWEDPQVNAGKVALLQPRTGLIYADGAVNHGHWATKFLQEGVGARVDGWCGPLTLAKVKLANDAPLAAYLLSRRKTLYLDHPDFPHAGDGWRHRLNQLAQDCDLRWHWKDLDHAA